MYTVSVVTVAGANMKLRKAIIVIAALEFSLALSAYATPPRPEVSWKELFTKQGILVEMGLVAGSPNYAFRGTGIVQTNIGRVISTLYDHTHANRWVHKLAESKALRDGNLSMVVWQRFDNPWPVKDRDFVYLANPTYDEEKKYFRASFSDITDTDIMLTDAERSRIPDQSCCVVGKLIYTEWQFRATGPKSTCVRVEVMFDPKGKVLAFFANGFLKKWPKSTIEGLQVQALREDVTLHEVFGNWVAERQHSMISEEECMEGKLEE